MNITQHAAERFVERIMPSAEERARAEIRLCFAAAKQRHKDRWQRKRARGARTAIVPTGCCMFVMAGRTMVTVLRLEDGV